MEIKNYIL